MTRIVLDKELRTKLNDLNESLELCDETGKTVGHFLPAGLYKQLLYAAVEAACPYSEEELKRFQQETGGRPLAEIWKSLSCLVATLPVCPPPFEGGPVPS